jgi:hypothetical protein
MFELNREEIVGDGRNDLMGIKWSGHGGMDIHTVF